MTISVDSYGEADAALRGHCFADAAEQFRQLVLQSGSVRALCGLASAELELGNTTAAEAAAAQATTREPDSLPARLVLARSLAQGGKYEQALLVFQEIATLKAARRAAPSASYRLPAHFALHNLEQWEYLLRLGSDCAELHVVGAAERGALRQRLTGMISGARGEPPWVAVSGPQGRLLADLPFIVETDADASEPPVNETLAWSEMDEVLGRVQPQCQVVDGFLSPSALARLNQFCLRSTIWRYPYKFGYVAAFPDDGMAPATVFAIAQDLRRLLPQTFGALRLVQWWCFAYDAELPGTAIHGDDSDVSVNLWLTPDEAVLDREHGGLVLWNEAAPPTWSFDDMNAGGERIHAHLRECGAEARVIPYRANRAVIFHGRLFHQTDRACFQRGFEHRRRNLTLLFRKLVS